MAIGLGAILTVACGHRDGSAVNPRVTLSAADREWEVRERRVERYLTQAQPLEPLGFGSGGGLTALVVRSPRAYHQFSYFDPAFPTGGLVADERKVVPEVPLPSPTDVVGVTDDGIVMYLDDSTGFVTTSSPSNRRVRVVAFDTTRRVQSACALDGGTIAFIERAHPGNVFVRETDHDIERTVAVRLDTGFSAPAWSDLRLTGSLGSGCALWSPTGSHVAILTPALVAHSPADTARRAPPIWPVVRDSLAWYDRIRRFVLGVGTRRCDPRAQRDVTILPGVVAVLAGCGDVIKLFAMDEGEYIEGIQLLHPTLRIAGAGPRVFALRQSGDSIFLASYVVPSTTRARVRMAALPDTTSPPPAWLRMARGEAR